MARRPIAVLALALLVLLLAGWLWLARERGASRAPGLPDGRPAADASPVALSADPASARGPLERRPAARETRFEPLPAETGELVVHVVEQGTRAPLPDAEVFALEVERNDWLDPDVDACPPGRDFEREVREGGRRLPLDARGDLHLPIPARPLALAARKGEWFGCIVVWSKSAPEDWLPLIRCAPCLVRVRDAAGAAVPGVGVALTWDIDSALWRGVSDESGQLAIPNLGWLLEQRGRQFESWCAALELPAMDAAQRWFARSDPLPARIDFVVEDSRPLRIEVRASDGQPAAIGGRLTIDPRRSAGSRGRMHLPPALLASIPIVRGVARLGRAEPGLVLRAHALLDGSVDFSEDLRVPQPGEPGEPLQLGLEPSMQLLEMQLVDESGTPLASRELEWISFSTRQQDVLREDQHFDPLRSDEQGRLVLAVWRKDLYPAEFGLSEEQLSERSWQGYLRLRGARGLESAPIQLSGAPAGARRDLGRIRLAPALPLARGRVRDDAGRPLAHVLVGVAPVRRVDGQAQVANLVGLEPYGAAETDAEGAFAVFGTCTGGRALLELQRQGYSLPHGAPAPEFECGSRADLDLVLVRGGTIQTRVHLAGGLDRELDWRLDEALFRVEHPGSGTDGKLLQRELGPLAPGSYRVQLRDSDSVLLDIAGVVVRSGERTLDPRLLDVDVGPLAERGPVAAQVPEKPVELRVLDADGRPIAEGLYALDAGSSATGGRWHAGRLVLREGGRLTLWSPGYRAWSGARPQESGEVRLEPSWRVEVAVAVPASLPRERCSLRIVPSIQMANWTHIDVCELLAPADLDAHGSASFEIPGECEMSFALVADVTDPAAQRYGETLGLAETTLSLTPDSGSLKFEVGADAWAFLEASLR